MSISEAFISLRNRFYGNEEKPEALDVLKVHGPALVNCEACRRLVSVRVFCRHTAHLIAAHGIEEDVAIELARVLYSKILALRCAQGR